MRATRLLACGAFVIVTAACGSSATNMARSMEIVISGQEAKPKDESPKTPEQRLPAADEEELNPEAMDPVVAAGAYLNCVFNSAELACQLLDENAQALYVDSSIEQSWSFGTSDFAENLQVRKEDSPGGASTFYLTLTNDTGGLVIFNISIDDRDFEYSFDPTFIVPTTDSSINGRIVNQEQLYGVEQDRIEGRTFISLLPRAPVGDGFADESDSCLASKQGGAEFSEKELAWTFRLDRDRDLAFSLKAPCGLQFGTSHIYLEGPLSIDIQLNVASGPWMKLFDLRRLPKGDYRVRVVPGATANFRRVDDFSFESLIFSSPD